MFDESLRASGQKTQTDWNNGVIKLYSIGGNTMIQTREENSQTNFEAIPTNSAYPLQPMMLMEGIQVTGPGDQIGGASVTSQFDLSNLANKVINMQNNNKTGNT